MKKSILPILGFILAGHASAAVTLVSSTQTHVTTNYAGITVPQFNTTLGTLTGVKVSVVAAAYGSISLTNNAALGGGNVTVTEIVSELSVRSLLGTAVSSGYGSTQFSTLRGSEGQLATTAAYSSAILAPQVAQTFVINAAQSFTINNVNIASSNFAYYQGTGNVTFEAKAPTSATISGGLLTSDTTNAGANVQFNIEYTYTAAEPPVSPVPEPTSVIFTGLLLGSGLMVRRRKVLA